MIVHSAVLSDGVIVVYGSMGYPLVLIDVINDNARVSLRTLEGIEKVKLDAASGTGLFANWVDGLSIRVNGVEVINSSKQFIGLGVNCPNYGIVGAGFNPNVGGVQYYGANGNINTAVLRSNPATKDLEYWNGSAWVSVGESGYCILAGAGMTFKGGVLV